MPKPETIAWLRQSAAINGSATSQTLLEVLERLERLEAAQPAAELIDPEPIDEADDPQTLHTVALQMVDTLGRSFHLLPEILDTLRRAIREPMEPTTEPLDEAENDRRFHACMKAIDEATPEQIRAATEAPQPPANLDLLDEMAQAIGNPAVGNRWRPEACRAVAVIVRRLREHGSPTIANWLEQEAAK